VDLSYPNYCPKRS